MSKSVTQELAAKFDDGAPVFFGFSPCPVKSVSLEEGVQVVKRCKRVARTWIFPMRNGIRSIMIGQRENK